MHISNAVITHADLYIEDHGILTISLTLNLGGSLRQGFGGHVLFRRTDLKGDPGRDYTGAWVWMLLIIAGVEHWHQLAGRPVRVKRATAADFGSDSRILAIGHVVDEVWFDPEAPFNIEAAA